MTRINDESIDILLVEDNPGDARLVREALGESPAMKAELVHVERLGEAIDRLDNHSADVVLLDLGLPESQGLDTLRGLLRNEPDLAVIVITGHADESLGIEALKAGAQDYLVKGDVQSANLVRAIHHSMERHRLQALVQQQTEDLQRRSEELALSNQELEDFSYIVSHDLKEPLRGISNYATFVIEDYGDRLDDKGREMLETLPRLAKRLETFLDDLLDYSRVGRLDLGVEETDLNKTVAGIVDTLQEFIDRNGADVRVPAPLPTVRCDSTRAGEVFRNLITNAVKYNDKAGKLVEISFRSGEKQDDGGPDAAPVFYVRDNGIGIPDKQQDAVFKIFKRLHARDKFGGGTGAGLTIVKRIVERHGGTIWLESEPGEGSTFYFTLSEGQPE